jgi:hypothetical protein
MVRLDLSFEDLLKPFQEKPPEKPKYFHFNLKDGQFHDAEIVTFRDKKGNTLVIKDRYGKLDGR